MMRPPDTRFELIYPDEDEHPHRSRRMVGGRAPARVPPIVPCLLAVLVLAAGLVFGG